MATRMQPSLAEDSSELLDASPLGDFVLVRTRDVVRDDSKRLRPIDPVWARALGQIMRRERQRTPIEICREPGADHWTLVSGGHRHAGAEFAEIEYLRAEIVSADKDDRRLREASENLWRRDLDPIDRATHVAEVVAIHKRRAGIDPKADGRAVSAQARWQKALAVEANDATETISVAYGWADEIGEQLGFTGRTIRNDLMLYRRLAPSVIAVLREARHPVLDNATQLRALAKLEPAEQARAVALLTSDAGGRPRTVGDAIARVRGSNRATDPEAKRLSAFLGAFQRMGLAEKKGALAQLAGMLPAGTQLGAVAPAASPFPANHQQYREEAMTALDEGLEFIDGLLEDEVVTGECGMALERVRGDLHMTRLTIGGHGFPLTEAARYEPGTLAAKYDAEARS